MKRYTNILFAVFLTASLSFTTTAQAQDYNFTIHLGAFQNAKLTDFENIRSFGYIYARKLNNLHQIYMGGYTSEAKATPVLNQVKSSGYPDAFITRRRLDDGQTVSVVQLGAEKVGADILWAKYAKAGPLLTYQDGSVIRIVTGPFENLDDAQSRSNKLRKIGFSGAFVKNVNSILTNKVAAFETSGETQIPDSFEEIIIPDNPKEEVVIAEIPPKKNPLPNVMVKKKAPKTKVDPRDEPRPKTYDDIVTPKSPNAKKAPVSKPNTRIIPPPKKSIKTNAVSAPYLRPKVKRTSVLKLQEVLKIEKHYTSSIDGLYGPGTKKGYKHYMDSDIEIQKYKLLSALYNNEAAVEASLSEIIHNMNNDVSYAVAKLKAERSALADAYQAYGVFELAGQNTETDRLMNKAIKASFSKKKLKNKPPFDFSKKHSYSDYKKLIQHIRYVHGATDQKIDVPCWLFEKHKAEAIAAFDPGNNLASNDYAIQDCGNIMSWESLRLLETIMKDMTPDLSKMNKQTLASQQSKRAQILMNPQALNSNEYKFIEKWNNGLWEGMNQWEEMDPLHSKMVTPLKVTYFQSWALIEDHLMNKGLKPREARGLSLVILRTIVEPYLSRYTK